MKLTMKRITIRLELTDENNCTGFWECPVEIGFENGVWKVRCGELEERASGPGKALVDFISLHQYILGPIVREMLE